MPLLVHITLENKAKALRRHGIAARRARPDPENHPEFDRVVWAFPVLPSYVLTHSWSRSACGSCSGRLHFRHPGRPEAEPGSRVAPSNEIPDSPSDFRDDGK